MCGCSIEIGGKIYLLEVSNYSDLLLLLLFGLHTASVDSAKRCGGRKKGE